MKARQWDLFIGGQWKKADKYEPLLSPHDGSVIASVAQADEDDAREAIEKAQQAFHSFKKTPAHERAEILYRVSRMMEDNKEEYARVVAAEAAKPIRVARTEIDRTVETYRFAAEAAKNIHGEQIPMDVARGGEGRYGFTMRTPLGVVTAITPFNFPFNLVAHKVGPAIAAGNTIVLKPAEQTPLSALVLADLFRDAGLPDGVLNIIPGSGRELSQVLTSHPYVKKVTFTGSPQVGHIIQQQAGFRKLTLELGSNSALIIDEGVDLTSMIDRVVQGAFSYNGQVCISVQRVYVHESLCDEFVRQFVETTRHLVVGSPLDEGADITAVISKRSLDRIVSWVDEAVSKGAKIECGGTVEGNALLPTVLTNVSKDTKLNSEEVFGPVVIIDKFRTLGEAIEKVNNSRYGLNAGIYTPRIDHAFYAVGEIETGGVIVNDIPTFRTDDMPYGGLKDSGVGREGIRYAVDGMMETKFVSFKI